jgi:starvation-inducible DNA-binding protein
MQTNRTLTTARIDIPPASRRQLIELLSLRLAKTFDLYSQLKQAHWNVKGSDFVELHERYDAIAANVLKHIDTIAERVAALGGLALGTTRLAANATRSTSISGSSRPTRSSSACITERPLRFR